MGKVFGMPNATPSAKALKAVGGNKKKFWDAKCDAERKGTETVEEIRKWEKYLGRQMRRQARKHLKLLEEIRKYLGRQM